MKACVSDIRRTDLTGLVVLFGIVGGFATVVLLALPLKWALSLMAGAIVIALAIFQSDLERFFQVLLALCIPLASLNHQFFVRRDYFGTPGIALGLVEILLIILYVLWFISGPSWETIKEVLLSKISIAALVLIVVSALSIFNAEDKALSVFGLISLIKMYLVFFYIANNVRKTDSLRFIVDFLVIALLIQQLLGIAQYFSGSSLGLNLLGESPELFKMSFGGETFARVAATLIHPNQFANFLGLGLPLALSLLITAKRPPVFQVIYASVFVLGILVFILTFSRTGWFHLATSTVVVVILSFWKGKIRPVVTNYMIVVGLVGCIFVLIFSNAIYLRVFQSSPVLVTARLDMNKVAWKMIDAHPWLGVGINNYVKALPHYDHIGVMQAPVHNLYLLIGAEIGIFGFAAFMILIIMAYRQLGKVLSSSNDLVCAVAIGIIGGITGFLVDGLSDFSFILTSTNLLFWFLIGLAVALPKIDASRGGLLSES